MTEIKRPVPIVRLILTDKEGKILILKRTNTAYSKGQWCLPGGKIDYMQTVEQAIANELREETSLECTSSRFLIYQDNFPEIEGEMHCINLYFICTADGEIKLNEESGEYAWIGIDDIGHYKIAFRNEEAVRKYWSES